MSTPSSRAAVFRRAKEKLGTTAYPQDALFILPDGEMAGRGGRAHAAITAAYTNVGPYGTSYIDQALLDGMVRIGAATRIEVSLEAGRPLTREQVTTIDYILDTLRPNAVYLDVLTASGRQFGGSWAAAGVDAPSYVERGYSAEAIAEAVERVLDRYGRSGLSFRSNPVPAHKRHFFAAGDVARLEALEARWLRAVARADAAYESGDYDKAEALDARAEDLAEQLEALSAAVEESGGHELEGFAVPLADEFAVAYADYMAGRKGRPGPTSRSIASEAELARLLRFMAQERRGFAGETVSDAALVEAAADAYESRASLVGRYQRERA